ncbi:glycosyltransferase family 4 protein [Babjeviella inositovora NRRL Y-12698]|uniref:Phosphatidylinositol N-acetylglucosaminyltransferase GPI3 subunit n=1 Tax=Babjeviella inositovora NRRL Y-12698 TaxID=984486 RepID=A0A1E3QY64_9ASCO|nr:glycosyltransferase family 4 protein [Babjeviella inositovora NRRL Y-12698]ODQ82534.1 glycosyltransferase family 4 protein [Babjeviella inositovora NRRL Y-12698]
MEIQATPLGRTVNGAPSYNIAMITDFFYPQPGGVELHVYHLSQKLMDLGHSVVVITHAYKSRTGVRYLTNGLKVYYVPFLIFYRETSFPSVFSCFPILRNIFIREQIDIIHGHGCYSSIGLEAIVHASAMDIKTVFTDHSLFGFADVASVLGNKTLAFSLSDVGHVICVSHTCKENTTLRARIHPSNVSVIPNAVIAKDFAPAPDSCAVAANTSQADAHDSITIVVISRLYQNKGADLLTAIIPTICESNPKIKFLIAGDGPKFIDLEQMREKYALQERVQLVGRIRHEEVRSVMIQGQIFFHPSLTEAFGTVLVEAASCGLLVVSAKVGGIPEVLPEHMSVFADETSEPAMVDAVTKAIQIVTEDRNYTANFHLEVKTMYSWMDVARRTENVYHLVTAADAAKDRSEEPNRRTLKRILKFYYQSATLGGKLYALCAVVDMFVYFFLELFLPRHQIDVARKWPVHRKGDDEVDG